MPLKKIVHGIKKLNKIDHFHTEGNEKKHIDELQKMDFAKFWKLNHKAIYLGIEVIIGLAVLGVLLTSDPVVAIKTDPFWAKVYFALSTAMFTAIGIYILNFSLTISIKQEFNTDNFMRAKMSKMKGVDWKSAEEPFQKKR